MTHKLINILAERISSGLKRRSITTCSRWAENCRVMGPPYPGPWTFKYHPWTREMHDCEDEIVVGQKAAQVGFTEWALNRSFYHIDIKGENVLYILPASTPDASDFSSSRFDPALELSPHLANLFSNVKNVGHKRAGSANLFIRGSRSKSQLRSLPASLLVFDEVDVMVQENIVLAHERTSGQVNKQELYLSTPTIDNWGINTYFRNSSQDHFFFPCPCCSKLTELTFPDCLVITADEINDPRIKDTHIICKECHNKLSHEDKPNFLAKGKWVPSYTNRMSRGFHVSQLYSTTVQPYELAVSWIRAQTNAADEQEFYNSKMGLTHVVEGARVSDSDLEQCTGQHKNNLIPNNNCLVTMGIDVGSWLHYEITTYQITKTVENDLNLATRAKVLAIGKVKEFEELDSLIRQYKVNSCVIDANPERRKALEFAKRFYGLVRLCFYGNAVTGKEIHLHAEDEHTMTVDRTSWLDVALSRYKRNMITIPINTPVEYKDHMKALVRIYEKDKLGNPVGKYVKGNDDDHYAHARCYCELALSLAAGQGGSQNITGVF